MSYNAEQVFLEIMYDFFCFMFLKHSIYSMLQKCPTANLQACGRMFAVMQLRLAKYLMDNDTQYAWIS